MKTLLLLVALGGLLEALPQPRGPPINEMEIDRALNAGRLPPEPIYDMPDIPGSESPTPPPEEAPEKAPEKAPEQSTSSSPASPPPPSPTSDAKAKEQKNAAPEVDKGYGDNFVMKENTCVVFDPPDRLSTSQMCKDICGLAVTNQLEAEHYGSTACIASASIGKDPWVIEEGTSLKAHKLSAHADIDCQVSGCSPATALVIWQ